MGRGHLTRTALLGAALLLVPTASAGVHWSVLGRGPAVGTAASGAGTSSPIAYIALGRGGTARFSALLPASAVASLARVDFATHAVVAVFGEFGCQDGRIGVSSIVRRSGSIQVSLVERPLAPGTMECDAIFPTYRLLLVSKAQLGRPLPTSAGADLARP